MIQARGVGGGGGGVGRLIGGGSLTDTGFLRVSGTRIPTPPPPSPASLRRSSVCAAPRGNSPGSPGFPKRLLTEKGPTQGMRAIPCIRQLFTTPPPSPDCHSSVSLRRVHPRKLGAAPLSRTPPPQTNPTTGMGSGCLPCQSQRRNTEIPNIQANSSVATVP